MKITAVEPRVVRLPYKAPIKWARRTVDHDDYVLLRISTDEGIEGWAEHVETISPQGTSGAVAVARGITDLFEPVLLGLDPLRTEHTRSALRQVRGWDQIHPMFDIALMDIRSKNAGLPCWKFMGGWTERVQVAWLVNRGPMEEMLQDAVDAAERYGFKAMKVKIGLNPVEELETMRQLRRALGPDMFIWVDGNSTYTQEQALWIAEGLAELDVRLFEDPCPLYLRERTRVLFERCPVPVMVDRGVGDRANVERWIDHGAAAIALKVSRIGYGAANAITRFAQTLNIPCVVGVSMETDLGSLQSLHFRGSLEHLDSMPAENIFFMKLQEGLLESPLEVKDGYIQLPDAPGMGVQVNEKAIEKYEIL